MKTLDKQGINTVLRQNEQGIIYGITYVDHLTKCVFNGSVLGKQYSAKGILERCSVPPEQIAQKHEGIKPPSAQNSVISQVSEQVQPPLKKEGLGILETLLKPEYSSAYVPNQLTRKGKKKKKKKFQIIYNHP